MMCLGDLAEGQGHRSKAVSLWKAAQPLFQKALQVEDMTKIDFWLSVAEQTLQKVLQELETLHASVHLVNEEISKVEEVEGGVNHTEEQFLVTV
jgi:hypothetical protein